VTHYLRLAALLEEDGKTINMCMARLVEFPMGLSRRASVAQINQLFNRGFCQVFDLPLQGQIVQ
jgi:hypothetical protein